MAGCRSLFPVFLGIFLCTAGTGTAGASEFDWREPGRAESDAVLAALDRLGTETMEELLYDGLDPDQVFTLETVRTPVLSLALAAGRTDVAALLIDEGADVELMSTKDARRTEYVSVTTKVRTK